MSVIFFWPCFRINKFFLTLFFILKTEHLTNPIVRSNRMYSKYCMHTDTFLKTLPQNAKLTIAFSELLSDIRGNKRINCDIIRRHQIPVLGSKKPFYTREGRAGLPQENTPELAFRTGRSPPLARTLLAPTALEIRSSRQQPQSTRGNYCGLWFPPLPRISPSAPRRPETHRKAEPEDLISRLSEGD